MWHACARSISYAAIVAGVCNSIAAVYSGHRLNGVRHMHALFFIVLIVAGLWFPHIISTAAQRARYYMRSRYGYSPKITGYIDSRK